MTQESFHSLYLIGICHSTPSIETPPNFTQARELQSRSARPRNERYANHFEPNFFRCRACAKRCKKPQNAPPIA
jgi:hypothetical protein